MVGEERPSTTPSTGQNSSSDVHENEVKAVVSEVLPTALAAIDHNTPTASDSKENSAEQTVKEREGDFGVDSDQTSENQPVTVLVSRRIKPDCEAEFENLLAELCELLGKREGFIEMKAYKPSDETDEHKVMISFETAATLKAWQDSEERKQWMTRAKPLELEPPRAHVLTGIESWFTLPEQEGMSPPPRRKMAIVTWMGIFPLVTTVNYILAPHLKSLPVVVQSAITSMLLTSLMTYLVMPRMTRLLAGFLYPEVKLPNPKAGKKRDK